MGGILSLLGAGGPPGGVAGPSLWLYFTEGNSLIKRVPLTGNLDAETEETIVTRNVSDNTAHPGVFVPSTGRWYYTDQKSGGSVVQIRSCLPDGSDNQLFFESAFNYLASDGSGYLAYSPHDPEWPNAGQTAEQFGIRPSSRLQRIRISDAALLTNTSTTSGQLRMFEVHGQALGGTNVGIRRAAWSTGGTIASNTNGPALQARSTLDVVHIWVWRRSGGTDNNVIERIDGTTLASASTLITIATTGNPPAFDVHWNQGIVLYKKTAATIYRNNVALNDEVQIATDVGDGNSRFRIVDLAE